MKYLCVHYRHESTWQAMSRDERLALAAEVDEYLAELRQRGQVVSNTVVADEYPAVTIWVRHGRLGMLNDALRDEGRLDGCLVIEAGDLNDAIRIAAHHPIARFGMIGVYPIQTLTLAPEQDRKVAFLVTNETATPAMAFDD